MVHFSAKRFRKFAKGNLPNAKKNTRFLVHNFWFVIAATECTCVYPTYFPKTTRKQNSEYFPVSGDCGQKLLLT